MVYRNFIGGMLSNRSAASARRPFRAAGDADRRCDQLLPEPRTDLGTGRIAARAAGRRRARNRASTARRAESLCLSQLPGFRHAAPVACDEAADRGGTENARDDRAQHQARPRWNPRARIYRAGAHADLRWTRSPASHRADRRRARAARFTRLSAVETRARTFRRIPLPARRRAQAANRRRPANPRAACRRRRDARARGANGFWQGARSAREIQRATQISSGPDCDAIPRDAGRRRRRVNALGLRRGGVGVELGARSGFLDPLLARAWL